MRVVVSIIFAVSICVASWADEALTYLLAVDAIVDRNPDVQIQASRIELVQARTLPTRLALLPSFSLLAQENTYSQFGLNESRVGGAGKVI